MGQAPEASYLQEIEARAIEFARGAGHLLLGYFAQPLEVEFKGRGRRDPVTAADRAAQDYLTQAIHEAFPEHAILGEEGPEAGQVSDSDYVWAVDPLDGTTNFINYLPIFAVSLGVLYRGQPVVGCIFASLGLQGEVFHAYRGSKAFQESRPLSVASDWEPGKPASLPAHYLRYLKPTRALRGKLGDVRSLGSIAYDLALVAGGSLQFAFLSAPRLWDVAAGVLLVQEAGGQVLIAPSRKGWQPLAAFTPAPGKTLAQWSAPLIAASPEVAWSLARNLRWGLGARLRRWLRRFQKGGQGTLR